jgi:hypothetical protein
MAIKNQAIGGSENMFSNHQRKAHIKTAANCRIDISRK